MIGLIKKIAICIPTYNRPEVILDTCLEIIKTLDDDLYDLYIYDSSTDNETEITLRGIEKNNFFYFRIDSSIHSSKKVYNIYQDNKIQNNYKYLWVLADYLFFSSNVIESLNKKINEDWDMIMLDFYDPEERGNKQYKDPNEIFFEYAWSITQYGILIINCNTVLKKADWNYLEEKYLNEECRNFSHIAMYFELMYQITDLKFYHFSVLKRDKYISKYRSLSSDYLVDYLHIWGFCWYRSIQKLPNYYKDKEMVIKKACIYGKQLGKQNLAQLKLKGVLTPKQFLQYSSIWKYVSTVHPLLVWGIIAMPKSITRYIAEYGGIKQWILAVITKRRLKKFCGMYRHIYLYGAGINAERLARFMDENSMIFDGFVVSRLENNKRYLKGYEVKEISQIGMPKSIGIILALSKTNKREVIPLLDKLGYKNIFQDDII